MSYLFKSFVNSIFFLLALSKWCYGQFVQVYNRVYSTWFETCRDHVLKNWTKLNTQIHALNLDSVSWQCEATEHKQNQWNVDNY